MKARYNYRFYPTITQQTNLAKMFGCSRVVWNDALAYCKSVDKIPKNGDLQKWFITQAKKTDEREWLEEVCTTPLQQSIRDLGQAFSNYFKSFKGERKGEIVGYPKFKKRSRSQSARFTDKCFKVKQHTTYIAKVGNLKTVWSRPLPNEPSSVTVIKDASGRYFLSFVVEIEPDPIPAQHDSVGIDLGVSTFATLSTGEKIGAPRPLNRNLRRLRTKQRKLAKKQKGSKRHERQRQQVAKTHARIKDIRTDFLHKLSTRLICENQAIAIEDLNVSGMLKNRKLSKAISDLGWYQFRTLLQGKATKYGREIQVISRWEPSSQACSNCGQRGGKKHLSIRAWECLNCGSWLDRDWNAAKNIKAVGGQSKAINGRGGKCKSTLVAVASEASTSIKLESSRL